MFHVKMCENVWNVGVLNPGMRTFDVVMKTEYGTSYNSYLVQGTEKTALIEAVHREYLDYLLENLRDTDGFHGIDCLVMNHNEPDHSGAIAKLLELYPNLKIYATQSGSIFLKNITNRPDLNVTVVKDGDTLDLGGKTLTFVSAPFLHWPDSMFTYLREDRILFTCDFLGAHDCEPQMFDHAIRYRAAYDEAFRGYYDAIFGPFPSYVRNGLDRFAALDVDLVAPSHGPMLQRGGLLETAVSKYRAWSAPADAAAKKIPVFYCSAYGNTRRIAERIADGIRDVLPAASVPVYDVIEHDMGVLARQMNESDAFLVGSPTINRDAVPPLHILLAHAEAIGMARRKTAVFGSYGWSGEAAANLRGRLAALKADVFEQDFRVVFVPTDADLDAAQAYGQKFAVWLQG